MKKHLNDCVGINEAYEEIFSSTEEMDILNPDNECRHYKIGDKVKLHKGGEGVIRGIVYCVLIGEDSVDDAILVHGSDMGEIVG